VSSGERKQIGACFYLDFEERKAYCFRESLARKGVSPVGVSE